MEWPPQNTTTFAVPLCVQCCTYVPPDKYEASFTNANGYPMEGTPSMDGSASGKLYRTVTWSGGFTIQYSTDGDCATIETTSTVSYSGTSTLNFDGTTSVGTVVGSMDGDVFAEMEATSPGLILPSGLPSDMVSTQTETTDSWSGTGECYPTGGGLYPNGKAFGTASATLSNVCTEEAAIAWAQEQAPGWSAWEVVTMDASWDYAFKSEYQAATPGVVGGYVWQRMKFRRTKGGFTPGAQYVCTMEAYRAPAETYDFALYATLEETLMADSSGTLVWEGEVPFARGYSTWIKARSFTATPA